MLIFDQLHKADRHLRALSWVMAAGLFTLFAGLWWVQVVRSRHYVEDQRNQSYRTVRVPAPRGRILDRNGVIFAENRASYSISLYLEDRVWRDAVQKEYKRAETTATQSVLVPRKPRLVERCLSLFGYKPALTQPRRLSTPEKLALGNEARYAVTSNIVWQLGVALRQPMVLTNEARFRQHYERRRALPFPLLENLTPDQIARFQEQSVHLPGVDMEIQPMRVYPRGSLAAHVVGCLTHFDETSLEGELASFNYHLPDYKGYDGIEASFDTELRGKAGAEAVLVNNLGYRQSETTLSPIEAGKNVTLTIDADLQRQVEQALADAHVSTLPVRGAAVVLDARTGEILALASTPTFNPSNWIPSLPKAVWNTYTNDEIAPLQNRAVFGNYMPGSTFKIMVALAGLESGLLDTNEIIRVEPNPADRAHGIIYVGKTRHPFKDTAPPGDFSFRRAFIKSSNGYFITNGLRITPQRIVAMGERFHFAEKTGIPLRESRGILPTTEWRRRENRGAIWSPIGTGNLSIGQGDLTITPLQLAVAIAAVANGGKLLRPQLVLRVAAPDELISERYPTARSEIRDDIGVSERSLETVRQAMLADVEDPEGTAYAAFHDHGRPLLKRFRIGGKTGTAQVEKIPGKFDHYTVWFTSYAVTDTPRYAVVVMIDHGLSGGTSCAPVAAKIYKALEEREQRAPAVRKDSLVKN